MSQNVKLLALRRVRRAGAVAAGVAVGGVLLATGPAHAAGDMRPPFGKVTARTGVNERMYPSTDSSIRGSLPFRATVGLRCKVRAQNIHGNDIWYLLRDRNTWVSGKYVDNFGRVPFCNQVQRYEGSMKPGVAPHAMG